jgi:long-chain acyl-CoA synthetase
VNRAAFVDAASGLSLNTAGFDARVQSFQQLFCSDDPQLVFVAARNDIDSVAACEAVLRSGHALFLADGHLPSAWSRLVECYRPRYGVLPRFGVDSSANSLGPWGRYTEVRDSVVFERATPDAASVHPDLAVVLSTSGSTGSPKTVRWSRRGVQANTDAIVAALPVQSDECVALHLPLSYAFGWSVLRSHAAVGSTVILLEDSVTSASFWSALRQHRVTTLPLTPPHATTLARLGLPRLAVPELRRLTQAGGAADPATLASLHAAMQSRNGELVVMYGQTEAGPRISVLPHAHWERHPGSVGIAVSGQVVSTGDGEVVVRGPSVMMGYAENAEDLARGDSLGGVLHTGDLGRVADDGMLYLTGRASRIAKVDGWRVSLDEMEQWLGDSIVVQVGDRLRVCTTLRADHVRAVVAERTRLAPFRVEIAECAELPLLPSGKPDREFVRTMR